MSFPEVMTWLQNAALLVRIMGGGFFLIGIGVGAMSLMSAGITQSEHREMQGKTAIIMCAIGLFIILTAPVWQQIIARIAGVSLP